MLLGIEIHATPHSQLKAKNKPRCGGCVQMKTPRKATDQLRCLHSPPSPHVTVLSGKIYSLNIWKCPRCLSLRYHVQIELGLSLRILLRNLTLQKQLQITQSTTFFPQPVRQS